MDLSGLSLKELKALRSDVEKAIATFETRQKQDALAQLESKAKEMGFTLSELFGTAPVRTKRSSAVAKYRHPENESVTWSGRGRQPKWVQEALKAGKAMSDLAI
jgi:DNA-binding protein H-NS